MNKEKLMVEAIRNGIVLDHIPSDKLFKIVSILQLDKSDTPITIGNNLESKQVGRKGIIKITNRFFSDDEINKIAILAPNIRLNVIKDYQVTEKRYISLPPEVHALVRCSNPKCITNSEPMATKFSVSLVQERGVKLTCHYCGRSVSGEDCELI